MKKWIEYSLKCRNQQAGFALPVSIGMGLIILLVGLTMLLRSQDSQVNAIAQKDTAKSLNAAETGISNIRALMNQYRGISQYPACELKPWAVGGPCLDSSSEQSWHNPENIPNAFLDCSVDQATVANTIREVAERTWLDVDSDNPDQGQYRLLNYQPSGSDFVLTVQGRVNADQPSESISEIDARFSLNPSENAPQEDIEAAGLWVKNNTTVGPINTDVLGPCAETINIDAQPQGTFEVKRLNLLMPSTPPIPPEAEEYSGGDLSDTGPHQFRMSEINPGEDPPLPAALSNQIVEIWVDGDIDLSQKALSIHACGNEDSCGPFQYVIYGTAASGSITLDEGTVICDLFIHAPNYDVVNNVGGATDESCGKDASGNDTHNTGVFWVNSWNNNGAVRTPVLDTPRAYWLTKDPCEEDQDPEYCKRRYAPDVYPPQIGTVESWNTKKRTDI